MSLPTPESMNAVFDDFEAFDAVWSLFGDTMGVIYLDQKFEKKSGRKNVGKKFFQIDKWPIFFFCDSSLWRKFGLNRRDGI